MAKYTQLKVAYLPLSAFETRKTERALSPRQRASLERDNELKAAMNEAAARPATEAVVIELKEGQKMPTLRAATKRLLKEEPRKLNWGVRGNVLVFSKGTIPGGRARAS